MKYVLTKNFERLLALRKRGFGLLSWAALIVFLSLSTFVIQQNLSFYQTTVTNQNVPAFDGTAFPVKQTVNWVATPATQWKSLFSDLSAKYLMDLPRYEPNSLATSTNSLKWGNPADDVIRNMKITYSVPYMGSYTLDGKEHTGSHLAVDIKAPVGTPVFAIANGVVVKVSNQSSGFGKHIVVKHVKVEGEPTSVLYSSYSHLNEIAVSEGDVVYRGAQIGKIGQTGTATTPHLHFQIDTDTAPWHPYWPFTSKEASDAGLGFTDAINNGLGKENALKNTISPMAFVQKYLTSGGSAAVKPVTPDVKPVSPTVDDSAPAAPSEVVEPQPVVTEIEVVDPSSDEPASTEIDAPAVDDSTTEVSTDVSTETVTEGDGKLFSDVTSDHPNYKAIEFLSDNGVIGGYPDGTFRPAQEISRVEVLKMILSTLNINLADSNEISFSDVSLVAWYSPYLATALHLGIVDGYPDSTFRPENNINRAEFYKMLVESLGADLPDSLIDKPYRDVKVSDWFAPYAEIARKKRIFPSEELYFRASRKMKREEVAEALYRVALIKKYNVSAYRSSLR